MHPQSLLARFAKKYCHMAPPVPLEHTSDEINLQQVRESSDQCIFIELSHLSKNRFTHLPGLVRGLQGFLGLFTEPLRAAKAVPGHQQSRWAHEGPEKGRRRQQQRRFG